MYTVALYNLRMCMQETVGGVPVEGTLKSHLI